MITKPTTAKVQLTCITTGATLERILQTLRYRGFRALEVNFFEQGDNVAHIELLVKGQAKLTTLQKSLEALIEVQECYLTEDKAKLSASLTGRSVSDRHLQNSLSALS